MMTAMSVSEALMMVLLAFPTASMALVCRQLSKRCRSFALAIFVCIEQHIVIDMKK